MPTETGDAAEAVKPVRHAGFRLYAIFTFALGVIPFTLLSSERTPLTLLLMLIPLACFGIAESVCTRGIEWSSSTDSRAAALLLITLATGATAAGSALQIAYGFGSVSEVSAGYTYSTLYSVTRMLNATGPLAMATLVHAWRFGHLSGRCAGFLATAVAVATFSAGLSAGYLSSAVPVVLTFVVAGFTVGLIRLRLIVALGLTILLILPILFTARDDTRESLGYDRSSAVVGPYERLRFDTKLDLIPAAAPSEVLDLPGAGLLLRTAVIPRVVDPKRPIIDVSRQINYAIGSTVENNVSFSNYGNAFWLFDWPGVILVSVLMGLVFASATRYFSSLFGVAAFSACAAPAVWPQVVFPEYLIAGIQALLLGSALAAFSLLTARLSRKRSQRRGSNQSTPAAHLGNSGASRTMSSQP